MKKNIFLLAVLVVVLAIGTWYALEGRPAKAPGTDTTYAFLPIDGPYKESAPYYEIAANYATSTSLSGSANASAIAMMRNFIGTTVTDFKTQGRFDHLTPEDISAMGFDQGRKETLQINYLIASSAHTVSYIYTIYEDTGGAHGNTVFKTFTFDTSSGALLGLGDLFASADYLTTLSVTARNLLPGMLGQFTNDTFIQDGTTPNEQNFQDFFFDNADFVVLFPPYQVAPYAAGPITLRIPSENLKGVLKTTYP